MKIKNYRRTKAYKSLMEQFNAWEKSVVEQPSKWVFDNAWSVYAMQLVQDMLCEDTPCSLAEVPDRFAKIRWTWEKFKELTQIALWVGMDDVYAQNENASDDLYSMFSDFADEMGEEEKKEKAK